MGSDDLDVWSWVARLGPPRLRSPSSPFFSDGDAACAMRTTHYLTQEDSEELLHKDFKEFPCSVPGCQAVGATFTQLHEYETHYNALHRHSCATCGKTLPSAYLLELHITETHDSFFAVASEKRPSYECFLEKCARKFWSHEERRDHGVQAHQFPTDFKFDEARRAAENNNNNNTEEVQMEEEEEEEPVQLRRRPSLQQQHRKASSASSSTMSSASASPRHSVTSRTTTTSSSSSPRYSARTPPTPRSRHSITSPSKVASPSSPVMRSRRPQNPPRVRPQSVLITPSRIPSPTKRTSTSPSKELTERRRFSLASVIGTRKSLSPPSPRRRGSMTQQSVTGGLALRESKSRPQLCDSSVELSRNLSVEEQRAPFSLSKMGEGRLSSQSTADVRSGAEMDGLSPAKSRSRIPVLRTGSCKIPETLSFGAGVPKGFQKPCGDSSSSSSSPYWHNRNYERGRGGDSVGAHGALGATARLSAFEGDLMDALPL